MPSWGFLPLPNVSRTSLYLYVSMVRIFPERVDTRPGHSRLVCQFLHRLNGCRESILFQRQRDVASTGQQGDRPGDVETS